MKRYPLLLLAASLFFCSFKSEEVKSVGPEKALPFYFAGYTWNGNISVGSSEFGYYTIPISAGISYYTNFSSSPYSNVITSASLANNLYSSSFSSPSTGGITSYSMTYTPSGTSYSIASGGNNINMIFTGNVEVVKTVMRLGQANEVKYYNVTVSSYPSISSASLPLDIP